MGTPSQKEGNINSKTSYHQGCLFFVVVFSRRPDAEKTANHSIAARKLSCIHCTGLLQTARGYTPSFSLPVAAGAPFVLSTASSPLSIDPTLSKHRLSSSSTHPTRDRSREAASKKGESHSVKSRQLNLFPCQHTDCRNNRRRMTAHHI